MKSRLWIATAIAVAVSAAAAPAMASARPFINRFNTISTLSPTAPPKGPAKGDVNPYGVAVVPRTDGKLVRGNVLVSNFNNAMNQQGTGSSIVQISPNGKLRVFAVVPPPTSTPAVGLTTALVALRSGYVIVGSLPAPGGDSTKATAGALSVLNWNGKVVETITNNINGPWDMTAVDGGNRVVLFVTNVLNGTVKAGGKVVRRGTVVRIALRIRPGRAPKVTSDTVIANGFPQRTDPNALVIGPTGVGLGPNGVLYVADSLDNRIAAVPRALTRLFPIGRGGMTVSTGKALNDPLGLTIEPNGDVISANGGDGNLVETSPSGRQVAKKTLVPNGGGDLFGLAIAPRNNGIYFVNDIGSGPAANSLQFLH